MPENKTLEDRLSRIEQTLEAFAKRFAVIERMLGAEGSTRATETALEAALKKRIAELERDRLALAERVSALEAGRLQARPEQVSDGFRKAIIALQAGLEPRPGDRGACAVSELRSGSSPSSRSTRRASSVSCCPRRTRGSTRASSPR